MYTDYRVIDEYVNEYQKFEKVTETITRRFKTFGYKRIKTSAFEKYDLYSQVNSSVNKNEMIKVIDYTGDVLVLRPDVTIPITKELAESELTDQQELRYFYVQDVFRQPFDRLETIESTQAGIEYFGNRSAEADAEVIALACQTLHDLGFTDIKIEIGHAGFFQELISQINLNPLDLRELKQMIQAKNLVEIRPFLDRLQVDPSVAQVIEQIPLLYGDPVEVAKRAQELIMNDQLTKQLSHLMEVYEIIKMYGFEDQVNMDLGLINHMDYYSDIIFQGFIGQFGQPVLMGGRYDHLADKFGANIPAIGFACEIDSLVQAIGEQGTDPIKTDVLVIYEKDVMAEAIQITNHLRARGYSVVASKKRKSTTNQDFRYLVEMNKVGYKVNQQQQTKSFTEIDELIELIEGGW